MLGKERRGEEREVEKEAKSRLMICLLLSFLYFFSL
jgi:hypothetical protein